MDMAFAKFSSELCEARQASDIADTATEAAAPLLTI